MIESSDGQRGINKQNLEFNYFKNRTILQNVVLCYLLWNRFESEITLQVFKVKGSELLSISPFFGADMLADVISNLFAEFGTCFITINIYFNK